jgi:hypothetical protein
VGWDWEGSERQSHGWTDGRALAFVRACLDQWLITPWLTPLKKRTSDLRPWYRVQGCEKLGVCAVCSAAPRSVWDRRHGERAMAAAAFCGISSVTAALARRPEMGDSSARREEAGPVTGLGGKKAAGEIMRCRGTGREDLQFWLGGAPPEG